MRCAYCFLHYYIITSFATRFARRKATKKRKNKRNNWYGRKKKEPEALLDMDDEQDQNFEDGDGFGANDDEGAEAGNGPQNVDDNKFARMFGGAKALGADDDDDEKYYNRNPMDETRYEEKVSWVP